jgi:hypothetical protein
MGGDGDVDVILGTRTGALSGRVEVWHNSGLGTFTQRHVLNARGEVNAVVATDLNADGYPDIVAGTKTHTNDKEGQIEVWINQPGTGYSHLGTMDSGGKVTSLEAAQMNADDHIDLVAGTKTGNSSGAIELWLNDGSGI